MFANAICLPMAAKLKQAGLGMTLRTFVIVSVVTGLLAGALPLLFGANLLLCLGLGLVFGLGLPRWFVANQSKIGVAGKFRVLDEHSPRIDPAVNAVNTGSEWEVKTYVRIGL